MAKIVGVDGMTTDQVLAEVQRGGKFVCYPYVVSVVVMTFRRGSDIHFIRPGESAVVKGLPYTLLTLVAGWWGFPWGLIRTPMALFTNLSGGTDVTQGVVSSIMSSRVPAQGQYDSGWGGSGNPW